MPDRERLKESLFASAFEDSADAVAGLTPDRRVQTWSRGAEELLGCGRQDARGRDFRGFFSEAGECDRLLRLAQESPVVRNFKCAMLRPDGAREFALLTARALRDAAGVTGYLVTVGSALAAADGVEASVVRDALPRLERFSAVGQMTAAFAHDVRGPLHIIASTAEYALEYLSPTAEQRESLEMIVRNAHRATGSIRALLNFARAGRCQLRPGSVNDVVAAAAEFVEKSCEKRGIAVDRRLGDVPKLLLDPNHLGAAVYNLLANAVDAMPERGRLTLVTERDPERGGVLLTVADTGAGMDPELLSRVLEGFFTTKEGGNGLGLYLTRRILAEHGAEMRVDSRRGAGTTVSVRFPPAPEVQFP